MSESGPPPCSEGLVVRGLGLVLYTDANGSNATVVPSSDHGDLAPRALSCSVREGTAATGIEDEDG